MPNKTHRDKHKGRAKSKPRHVADVMHRVLAKQALPSVSKGWRETLIEALDPELGPHIATVLLKPRELVVFTESAAWCTRLKLALAQIGEAARARDPGITKISVRIMPAGAGR